MTMKHIYQSINNFQLNDFFNLSLGLFKPQHNYVDHKNFKKIKYKYKFNKNLSTIPISFQIKEKINVQKIFLYYRKINIGHILVNEIFMIDENDLLYLYGINDKNKFFHPGFVYQKSLGKYAVGGKPIINRNNFKFF